jgi:hypothetical protein
MRCECDKASWTEGACTPGNELQKTAAAAPDAPEPAAGLDNARQ